MADELMKTARFESKKTFELPKGATLLKSSHTLRVKEIENGFLITKDYEIEYKTNEKNSYSRHEYYTKEWYSVENPISIKVNSKDKSLAELL